MKLIAWNCQGAFRKKVGEILKARPDLLVISECEHIDKLVFAKEKERPKSVVWMGDNTHKGLGVFSYSNFKLEVHAAYNPAFKIVIPILVTDGSIDFTLLAIWANNRDDPDGQYVEQIWKAIHYYNDLLESQNVILAGDFNSNTIWDRPRRVGNHSAVVSRLAGKNIHSIYHKHFVQEQGKEKHATFYLHRDQSKPYHLDYCFASDELCNKVKKMEVGTYRKWIKHSDHTPLIVEFEV